MNTDTGSTARRINPKGIILALVLVLYVVPVFFGILGNLLDNLSFALRGYPESHLVLKDAALMTDEGDAADDSDEIALAVTMEITNHGSRYALMDENSVNVLCYDSSGNYLPFSDYPVLVSPEDEIFLPAGRTGQLTYLIMIPRDTSTVSLRCWSGLPDETESELIFAVG